MPFGNILGTIWYNKRGTNATFVVPVTLSTGTGTESNDPDRRFGHLTDDVTSMLDRLRGAMTIRLE